MTINLTCVPTRQENLACPPRASLGSRWTDPISIGSICPFSEIFDQPAFVGVNVRTRGDVNRTLSSCTISGLPFSLCLYIFWTLLFSSHFASRHQDRIGLLGKIGKNKMSIYKGIDHALQQLQPSLCIYCA